jgi:hypothetical protein
MMDQLRHFGVIITLKPNENERELLNSLQDFFTRGENMSPQTLFRTHEFRWIWDNVLRPDRGQETKEKVQSDKRGIGIPVRNRREAIRLHEVADKRQAIFDADKLLRAAYSGDSGSTISSGEPSRADFRGRGFGAASVLVFGGFVKKTFGGRSYRNVSPSKKIPKSLLRDSSLSTNIHEFCVLRRLRSSC